MARIIGSIGDPMLKELAEGQKEVKACLEKINVTLVRHEETLKQHIYRTEIAEKRLDKVESEIVPLKASTARVDGALRFFGIVATAIVLITTIIKLLLEFF